MNDFSHWGFSTLGVRAAEPRWVRPLTGIIAQELGPKAYCLVDLGHHAPNVNIEQIVARLHRFGKLGGFHFNDSKYGDDDLDSGSINPHQLFLVFNELVEAELNPRDGFNPSYMIDQSHNVTDPIESMLSSAEAITQCFAKALLVDSAALVVGSSNFDFVSHRANAEYVATIRDAALVAEFEFVD